MLANQERTRRSSCRVAVTEEGGSLLLTRLWLFLLYSERGTEFLKGSTLACQVFCIVHVGHRTT